MASYFDDYSDDVKNNIFVNTWGQGVSYINSVGEPSSHSNNLFYSSGGATPSLPSFFSTSEGDLNSNPLFTNASGNDFTITSTSPAYNAGTSSVLATAPTDFFNQPMLSGAVSIGAFGITGNVVGPVAPAAPLNATGSGHL